MEIISGIHKIDNIRGANSYLVIRESKMLLIDTGLPGNAKRIIKYIKELEKNPSDISHIIITHADIDHIGSVAELKKLTNASIAIHAEDASILAGKSKFKAIKGPLGIIFRLFLPLMRFHPVNADIIIQDNFELDGFQVIHTPGHTRGSISLYLPGKLIFVGDAIYKRFALNAAQARASLNLISKLEFDVLFPGHGTPIVGAASSKFKELVEHITSGR